MKNRSSLVRFALINTALQRGASAGLPPVSRFNGFQLKP
jgi:hypothetical protein